MVKTSASQTEMAGDYKYKKLVVFEIPHYEKKIKKQTQQE